jgi:NAD(P)H-flavin reductase
VSTLPVLRAVHPGPGDDPWVPMPVQITKATRELPDVFTLELDVSRWKDKGGFVFSPGQFNMLYHFGVGEVAISISGNPTDPGRLIHTIRAVGTVTQAMQSLSTGATLGLRGPFGTPWPIEQSRGRDVLVIAGGLGLAPLRPVIYHILAHRKDYGRLVILYGARTPEDLLFVPGIDAWRKHKDVTVEITVDRADRNWTGHVGVVPALLGFAPFDTQTATVMVCGPEIMMRYTARDLQAMGVTPDRIYVSMERNMKCAVGLCGHCQYGPTFVCKDGPVYPYDQIDWLFARREI